MNFSKSLGYLRNCFWLLLPILAFNLLFTHLLPAAYQADIFWKDIPKAISVPENLFRILVMVLPVFMKLRISTANQRLGFGIYLFGLLVYFASWAALVLSPRSAWSTSEIGFLAPAYTPILWLTGIGLTGDELQFPKVSYRPRIYLIISAVFLLFHNLHAATVFSRGI
jgi:hypothetical protein